MTKSELCIGQTQCPENWFPVQLRPNMSVVAARNLERQGFDTFRPTRLETRRVRGRHKTEARPLFPGYIFVRLDPNAPNAQSINGTRGVIRLVAGPNGHSRPLATDFMAELFLRCDQSGVLQPDQSLQQGDKVKILNGPFAGILSQIEKVGAQERLCLLLNVMGRQVRTTLPSGSVSRLAHPAPA